MPVLLIAAGRFLNYCVSAQIATSISRAVAQRSYLYDITAKRKTLEIWYTSNLQFPRYQCIISVILLFCPLVPWSRYVTGKYRWRSPCRSRKRMSCCWRTPSATLGHEHVRNRLFQYYKAIRRDKNINNNSGLRLSFFFSLKQRTRATRSTLFTIFFRWSSQTNQATLHLESTIEIIIFPPLF